MSVVRHNLHPQYNIVHSLDIQYYTLSGQTVLYTPSTYNIIHSLDTQYYTLPGHTVLYTPWTYSTIHSLDIQYYSLPGHTVLYTPWTYSTIHSLDIQYFSLPGHNIIHSLDIQYYTILGHTTLYTPYTGYRRVLKMHNHDSYFHEISKGLWLAFLEPLGQLLVHEELIVHVTVTHHTRPSRMLDLDIFCHDRRLGEKQPSRSIYIHTGQTDRQTDTGVSYPSIHPLHPC